jgi:hypothetical protein
MALSERQPETANNADNRSAFLSLCDNFCARKLTYGHQTLLKQLGGLQPPRVMNETVDVARGVNIPIEPIAVEIARYLGALTNRPRISVEDDPDGVN